MNENDPFELTNIIGGASIEIANEHAHNVHYTHQTKPNSKLEEANSSID